MQILKVGVGWGLQVCISNKLPEKPDGARPPITLQMENSCTYNSTRQILIVLSSCLFFIQPFTYTVLCSPISV